MSSGPVGIGMLGMGTVGTEVARALLQDVGRFADVTERGFALRSIAVRRLDKDRGLALPGVSLVDDCGAVVRDPAIDLVIEVIGGLEPARTLIKEALANGKVVVTANKAVIATHGKELTETATAHGGALFCEAAAVGAVPVVRAVRESLAGDRVSAIAGILNGTCNYILTQMTSAGASFADALADAQRLGYAEADPTSDVSGEDAAYKLALLAAFAFGEAVDVAEIAISSIERVGALDIAHARELGHVIKQVGVAELDGCGGLNARVGPVLLSCQHPLASVNGAFNAVWLQARDAGPMMLYGQGAGGSATASAVLGDVVAGLKVVAGNKADALLPLVNATVRSVDEHVGRHYCRIAVADQPGVLAVIAGCFGDHGVSIETFVQKGRDQDPVDLVFITHAGRAGDLKAALTQVRQLSVVHDVAVCLGLFEEGS
jgi:homoserine dehydrogenase